MESDFRILVACCRPRVLVFHVLFWGLLSLRVLGAALLNNNSTNNKTAGEGGLLLLSGERPLRDIFTQLYDIITSSPPPAAAAGAAAAAAGEGAAEGAAAAAAAAAEEAERPPCWTLEEFVVTSQCQQCTAYQTRLWAACSATGYVEQVNCTRSNKDEHKSCRSAVMEENLFWRFEAVVLVLTLVLAVLVVTRQRWLDRLASEKVRRQIESI